MKIRFGALSPQLRQQINAGPDEVDLEQKLADAIAWCSTHGVLTDSEVRKARNRIVKMLEKKGF